MLERRIAVLALFGAMIGVAGQAQTFATIFNFHGADGEYPVAKLVQGVDGRLYGTTSWGGANAAYPYGGTIFRITLEGALTTLYDFCAQDFYCPEGDGPYTLFETPGGGFYGAAVRGGKPHCPPDGCGTIFSITSGGTLHTLYTFCSQGSSGNCPDGWVPIALVQSTDGSLYGATNWGGASCNSPGCGTAFKMAPDGTRTTLHSFCSQVAPNGICADGVYPTGLIQGLDGSFYGTTEMGGESTGPLGFGGGTIFKIDTGGALTVVHSFCAQFTNYVCTDGAYPMAGLIQAADGNFYGTTSGGDEPGTIFQMTPAGKVTTLYTFCAESGCTDGEQPFSGLVQGSDGSFYGTTTRWGGATFVAGTIFKITPGGKLTTLYRFCSQANCIDGVNPIAALVQATDGNIYGTTPTGGAQQICTDTRDGSCGTVFRLSVGLAPFVKTLPHAGMPGSAVTILGTDLTGTTSVRFNGTPAIFTVVSSTEIKTIVPAGSSTGKIEVATPAGTLASGGPFLVR